MKQMQNFYKKISSKDEPSAARERCLAALTHLKAAQVDSLATSDPWFIWSAETAVAA